MDRQNFNDLISMSKSEEEMLKVKLILENKNVPDPYYGDISDFKNVFKLLDKVCDQISRELLHEKR